MFSFRAEPGGREIYMRIEAYTQVQQLYSTQKTQRTQESKKASFSDQLQISSMGKDIQTAKSAVASAPDIREDIVAPLRDQVQSGTYSVDTGSFADKLFAKYEEMR